MIATAPAGPVGRQILYDVLDGAALVRVTAPYSSHHATRAHGRAEMAGDS